ncbi:MAG TPA: hypothetical protein VFC03_07605 [Acidimicrobiales bacterium]|nr:hypothetical protein [Acidimicrobiales bacterium]
MSVLVLDVGTSDVRASLVRSDGRIWCTQWGEVLAVSPDPGLSEFDPPQMAIDHDWIQTRPLHRTWPTSLRARSAPSMSSRPSPGTLGGLGVLLLAGMAPVASGPNAGVTTGSESRPRKLTATTVHRDCDRSAGLPYQPDSGMGRSGRQIRNDALRHGDSGPPTVDFVVDL